MLIQRQEAFCSSHSLGSMRSKLSSGMNAMYSWLLRAWLLREYWTSALSYASVNTVHCRFTEVPCSLQRIDIYSLRTRSSYSQVCGPLDAARPRQKADTASRHKLEEHEDRVLRVRRSHGGMQEIADVCISLRTAHSHRPILQIPQSRSLNREEGWRSKQT